MIAYVVVIFLGTYSGCPKHDMIGETVSTFNLATKVLACGKRIGNQVKILSGPATVISLPGYQHSGYEKVRRPAFEDHIFLFAETGDGGPAILEFRPLVYEGIFYWRY